MSDAGREKPGGGRCVAVIVGGGSGTRFGSELPKQFLKLAGKPVFSWAIESLAAVEEIEAIQPVIPTTFLPTLLPGDADDGHSPFAEVSAALSDRASQKLRPPVGGGASRHESVLHGLKAIDAAMEVAAVHDAARPFPPVDAIKKAITACQRQQAVGGGAILAHAAISAVKAAKQGSEPPQISGSLNRDLIWLAQTPQIFPIQALKAALESLQPGQTVADEAEAMEKNGAPVALIEGNRLNLKITHPQDLALAEAYLEAFPEYFAHLAT